MFVFKQFKDGWCFNNRNLDSDSVLPGGRYNYLESHLTYNLYEEFDEWRREWANHYDIISKFIRQYKRLIKSSVTPDEDTRQLYIYRLHILRCKARLLMQIRIHAENHNVLFKHRKHQFNTQTHIIL